MDCWFRFLVGLLRGSGEIMLRRYCFIYFTGLVFIGILIKGVMIRFFRFLILLDFYLMVLQVKAEDRSGWCRRIVFIVNFDLIMVIVLNCHGFLWDFAGNWENLIAGFASIDLNFSLGSLLIFLWMIFFVFFRRWESPPFRLNIIEILDHCDLWGALMNHPALVDLNMIELTCSCFLCYLGVFIGYFWNISILLYLTMSEFCFLYIIYYILFFFLRGILIKYKI